MKKALLLLAGTLGCAAALAANPGSSAKHCIRAMPGNGKVNFVNHCGKDAFVIYCGKLKYTSVKCGDKKGVYYTHSFNLGAGESRDIDVKGAYGWGACLGGTSFRHDEFSDTPSGDYECKKTRRG